MNKVNVGVVGVGAMGHNHVRVYTRLKNANLLAVSDLMKGTLAEVSKKYNTVGFVDYDNVLKMPEIDAVSVCVPTTYHYEVVMSAIEQGKHVLVEKPIAFTLKEAKDMVKAARKQGVKLATGHVERFNPAVLEAKKLLRDKLIGEVVSVSAKRVGPFPPRIKDVGVTIDLAIHEVDVMAYLMDSPVSKVYAHVGSRLEKCEYEDHAEIMMEFYNNAIGMLEVNWLTPYKKRQLEVTGTDGIISLDYIDQTVEIFGKNARNVRVPHHEPLMEELDSFLNAIMLDEKPKITGEDGIHALKTVLASMKSAKEKTPIKIDMD
ncbi:MULTISPECIES: Gfo/Idh/MocA family protein [Methanobacterium]|uniref:Gfo/Idh/MocA family oxidoreductase n=1 Tax=Methanobacterium formicicum TaxID=2162 RepID=A0A090I0W7_METFO|nr:MULTISPECIES: Gfo/Idh/MocA family oxidoreductase [Methanobacterium]AIS32711.1 oxidoreductase GFO/IDH/MOCA family [Methanobacterium formicicum]KUK75248.1 MAG: Oxidoreductase domain-containing protein [Methanobacterium sp. 42_16]MBF4476171.1 Gfo/Idh/MocA family oxidoreductase [Methanobacterium formicicum]MDD4810244.1 Gfo/Idh/MocA family oxidoreductase [Methanobacterium formicicum]MDG3546563.1 Gfo/Idh/MocA family oxidoreductase [Methanobacterium formicicum]